MMDSPPLCVLVLCVMRLRVLLLLQSSGGDCRYHCRSVLIDLIYLFHFLTTMVVFFSPCGGVSLRFFDGCPSQSAHQASDVLKWESRIKDLGVPTQRNGATPFILACASRCVRVPHSEKRAA